MFPRISTPSVASLVLQGPGRSHGCHHFTGRKKQTPQPQVFCPSRGGKQSSQLESLGNFGSYKPSGSQLRGCMGIRRESSKYLLIGYIATQSASDILILYRSCVKAKSQALTRIATNRPLRGRRIASASILGEIASRIPCSEIQRLEKYERNQKLLEAMSQ